MSHVTHTNEPCRTYEWVMSHIWMSHIWICHVTRVNESCHTWEWVMSHLCMSHVTRMNESMNESCHIYEWIVYTPQRHRTEQFPKPWKGLIAWSDSFICVMRLNLYIYECRDSLLRVTWLVRVRHASELSKALKGESCHTYEWVMSHVWMSHVTRINESCHTYGWVMSHVLMSHVTRMDESCHTY